MKRRFKIAKLIPLVLSLIFMGIALGIVFVPVQPQTILGKVQHFLSRMDSIRYDIKVSKWKVTNQVNAHPIVIVDIDGQSMLEKGPWPWKKRSIAHLIAHLREQGVSMIAFDEVLAPEETHIHNQAEKQSLGEKFDGVSFEQKIERMKQKFRSKSELLNQVEGKKDIILPFSLNTSAYIQGILPKPLMTLTHEAAKKSPVLNMSGYVTNFNALQRASEHNGFVTEQRDKNGLIRTQFLVLRHNNKVYPSLPLAVAKRLYPEKKIHLNTVDIFGVQYLKSIQFGGTHISTDKHGRVWVPTYDKTVELIHISVSDLLNKTANLDVLKSAIVFVGPTTSEFSLLDKHLEDQVISHVEVQAIILKSILEGESLYTPYWSHVVTTILILIFGSVIALILPLLKTSSSILFVFVLQVLIVLGNLMLFLKFGIVLLLSVPLLMGVFLIILGTAFALLFERQKKTYLRKAFDQYVPPDYLTLLLEDPDAYGLEGRSLELTVLFADIRHFTSISERLDASGVKKLLNTFFTPMTFIILKHKGTIDKYVGDMIMAFWGAPIENLNHAEAAIDASLDMLAKTKRLERKLRIHGLPRVELGIGLNTGLMNVGDMGSKFRRSYTVIGDAVNLGSRLQSATAYYGVKLLVGPATKQNQTKFIFRLIDKVIFKGKHEVVEVYEVVCRKSEATYALTQALDAHANALDAYFAKEFVLAEQLFEALVQAYPDTKLYQVFLERIEAFKKHPPSPDWDGAYVFKDK